MNLHAISYFNIGPFKNNIINIFFQKGKYLIKAPVGSGKSFLFFDGPMYALYKYSNRNLLNIMSKTGFMKLWFETNGVHYLVTRNLKKGKSKDSCTSNFYVLGNDITNIANNINILNGLKNNEDIESFIKKNTDLEEINFKNETDLQQHLLSILVPKEVFQSTIFLMQDAQNIFELSPADRLTVLKNVFGLLGIDDAKSIIADKKREIWTELKVKGDTSQYDLKLKKNLNIYFQNFKDLQNDDFFDDIFSIENKFIENIKHIYEKININEFSMQDFSDSFHQNIKQKITDKKNEFQKINKEYEIYKKNYKELQNEEKQTKLQIEENQKILEGLNFKIKKIDPEKIKILKFNKQKIRDKQILLESIIQKKTVENFYKKHKQSLLFKDWNDSFPIDINLSWTNSLIDYFSQQGKIFKGLLDNISISRKNIEQEKSRYLEQIKDLDIKKGTQSFELFQQKCKNFEQIKKNMIEELKNKINLLEEKEKNQQEQIKKIDMDLKNFSSYMENQSKFYCEKISTNCPFIKRINKQTFEKLEEQYKKIEQEKNILLQNFEKNNFKKQIEELKIKLDKLNKDLTEFKKNPNNFLKDFLDKLNSKKQEIKQKMSEQNYEGKILELNKNENIYNKLLKELKIFLTDINWKEIKNNYQNFQILENEKNKIDKEIMNLENDIRNLEDYKLQKERITVEIKNFQNILGKNINKQKDISNKLKKINEILDSKEFGSINRRENIVQNIDQSIQSLKQLSLDFEEIKIKLRKLKEEEKIVNNLYYIFSKELLLIVLEDSLPILTEIINGFLSQSVDFQINIFLNNIKSEKIELEAKIYDEKGERDVKSLSGGQKVILKLVRMLAISAYIKSPILFLDETINNLDQNTVGKITNMLEDFVKKNDIKLYTITHSQQFQEMNMRDSVLNITEL